MYAIKTQDGRYYNGRATTLNGTWSELLSSKDKAFDYHCLAVAQMKATRFNEFTSIHGFTFTVEQI